MQSVRIMEALARCSQEASRGTKSANRCRLAMAVRLVPQIAKSVEKQQQSEAHVTT